ncbi:hypothetical protein HJB67_13040 [Rhizobium lentis]|uniref:hypothetical protein n=1 Tax=Rhizobium lentis TaxID=1138194 RepID=UPI001C831BB1|nr:hypothetical protein [Rhizobium lentis]MBX5010881.1 hypothetical protein [Rhizobium lentis]
MMANEPDKAGGGEMSERDNSPPPSPPHVVLVKPLEWREDWGGSLDDIPGWRAFTPFGHVSVSIAGHRDPQGRRYLKHADIPADLIHQLQWTAEVAYRGRILSALLTEEGQTNAE